MHKNIQTKNLLITFGGILASLIVLNLGSSVDDVNASTNPDYLLGNLTSDPSMPQAILIGNLSEQSANILMSMRDQANGNLTKLDMLLLDEMEKRNMINSEDRQGLQTLLFGTMNIDPSINLTMVNREVSSLVDSATKNTSNPTLTSLLSTLKHVTPDIGTNTGTLISNNVTNGTLGLPPLTIDASSTLDGIIKNAKTQTCGVVGWVVGEGVGTAAAFNACNLIL